MKKNEGFGGDFLYVEEFADILKDKFSN